MTARSMIKNASGVRAGDRIRHAGRVRKVRAVSRGLDVVGLQVGDEILDYAPMDHVTVVGTHDELEETFGRILGRDNERKQHAR